MNSSVYVNKFANKCVFFHTFYCTRTNTSESMHSEMGPVDKTQSREL